jgi:hypothetical protein
VGDDPQSSKKERWLTKGVVTGLATNIVWAIILAALAHSHIRWIPPGSGLGATLEGFFVYKELLIFGGGLLVLFIIFGVLADDIPDYFRSNKNPSLYRDVNPGRELQHVILLRIGYSLALLLAAETFIFIAGTIYNLVSRNPVLTPFINTQ